MSTDYTPPTAMIVTSPIHLVFAQFPVVCFTLTLLTDIAYWQTGNLMWQNFSSWLLFAGVVVGVLAVLVGIVEFLVRQNRFAGRTVWPHAVGYVLVLGLAVVNGFVHAGDGWTAVVPWGLVLSGATVVLILAVALLDRSLAYRHAGSELS
ncbi:DUF2231 domain-containing protein [Ensifer sp. LCM 4579]|uniref:DUF2231 domain-containing protein n=1 Tax=Ensifer sp. LCM 4579 TaxID=1848292 RepID=UPI0008D9F292|nr:DUF2231 domain-containing protein [Ensifer sp. LCM 4579]OHV80978.1 hypothetical protein LCM4579_21115 [Ensifer sp. LCM 4579]